MEEPQLKIGDHFWALMDGYLVIIIYEHENEGFYLCGSWECSVKREDFKFIELIKKPAGHENAEFYYTRPIY